MQRRADEYPLEARIPLDVIAGAEQAFLRLQEIFFGENKNGLSVTLEGIHKPLSDYLRMMESMPDSSKPMEKIAAEAKRIVECGNYPDYLKRLATMKNADWFDHRHTLDVWYQQLTLWQSQNRQVLIASSVRQVCVAIDEYLSFSTHDELINSLTQINSYTIDTWVRTSDVEKFSKQIVSGWSDEESVTEFCVEFALNHRKNNVLKTEWPDQLDVIPLAFLGWLMLQIHLARLRWYHFDNMRNSLGSWRQSLNRLECGLAKCELEVLDGNGIISEFIPVQLKHPRPDERDKISQAESSVTRVLSLYVSITLNAIADCEFAAQVEKEVWKQIQIENALHAIRTHGALKRHSTALIEARGFRRDKDRSNPEHWERLDTLLRDLFGKELTEIELFEGWREFMESNFREVNDVPVDNVGNHFLGMSIDDAVEFTTEACEHSATPVGRVNPNPPSRKTNPKGAGRKRVVKLTPEEKKIQQAWKSGSHPTCGDCDLALGLGIGTTKTTLDRLRKRSKKTEN